MAEFAGRHNNQPADTIEQMRRMVQGTKDKRLRHTDLVAQGEPVSSLSRIYNGFHPIGYGLATSRPNYTISVSKPITIHWLEVVAISLVAFVLHGAIIFLTLRSESFPAF